MICHILLADVLRQMVALATTSPSCHLPTLSVCQTCPLHAAIFATKFLQQIYHFLTLRKFTHMLVKITCTLIFDSQLFWHKISSAGCSLTSAGICWSVAPVPAFVLSSGNVNRSFYWGELFIHPMKGSPPTSHSHHSMWYFRIPSSLTYTFIITAKNINYHNRRN